MSTGFWLIILTLLYTGALLTLEVVRLSNQTPEDHITAVVRKAVQVQPGPFIWFAFSLGFLCGHLTWW